MRKSKLFITSLLMIITMFVFAGCQQGKQDEVKKTDTKTPQVTIEVTMDNGKETVAKEKVKVKNGEKLYDAMKENFKIEDQNGMITSIEGKQQDVNAKKYWMFDVNKEPAMKGAKDIELKDGDVITWDLHEAK